MRTALPRSASLISLALGALLLFVAWPANLARAQEGAGRTVTADAYWQQVERALGTVEELKGAGAEAVRPALDALAAEFDAISGVELADGRRMPLDSGYLVALFQDPDPDLERLETTLTAMLASGERWPDPSHSSQDLDPLADILARPDFQSLQKEPGPLQNLLQRIEDFLVDLLNRILPRSATGSGSLTRVLLTAAGVIALTVTVIFTLRGILSDIVADEEGQATGEDGLTLVSAEQALEQARSYSRSGDYRSAVRYLYISSLMLLEERGLVRYDRTQTNQEYLHSVAGRPELANVLRDVIDVFDRVWYGFQVLDEQAFAHYAGRVEQLRRQR